MYTEHTINNIIDLTDSTKQSLNTYVEMLKKWQGAVNLISKHTLHDVWHRHIADSIQAYPLIPKDSHSVADLGSGGGLPAVVLAILSQDKNIGKPLHITMIESDKKKALFLQQCIRELRLNAQVLNTRIEQITDTKFDTITSRALSDLNTLLGFTKHLHSTHAIFLKGKTADAEISSAHKNYDFSYTQTPSITDPEASILSITLS